MISNRELYTSNSQNASFITDKHGNQIVLVLFSSNVIYEGNYVVASCGLNLQQNPVSSWVLRVVKFLTNAFPSTLKVQINSVGQL